MQTTPVIVFMSVPDGKLLPTPSQYIPAVQSVHWDSASSPVMLLNVPSGQGIGEESYGQ